MRRLAFMALLIGGGIVANFNSGAGGAVDPTIDPLTGLPYPPPPSATFDPGIDSSVYNRSPYGTTSPFFTGPVSPDEIAAAGAGAPSGGSGTTAALTPDSSGAAPLPPPPIDSGGGGGTIATGPGPTPLQPPPPVDPTPIGVGPTPPPPPPITPPPPLPIGPVGPARLTSRGGQGYSGGSVGPHAPSALSNFRPTAPLWSRGLMRSPFADFAARNGQQPFAQGFGNDVAPLSPEEELRRRQMQQSQLPPWVA